MGWARRNDPDGREGWFEKVLALVSVLSGEQLVNGAKGGKGGGRLGVFWCGRQTDKKVVMVRKQCPRAGVVDARRDR